VRRLAPPHPPPQLPLVPSTASASLPGTAAPSPPLIPFRPRPRNHRPQVSALLRSLGVGGYLPDTNSPGGEQLYSFWQRHKALRYALYAAVVVLLLLMLVVLPATLYLHTFKRMVCG
jgi:hypothetical protein